MNVLTVLAFHVAALSLVAFGGISTLAPELHRLFVIDHAWMNEQQFLALYAISQAAPGPNMLFIALYGWQVAGILGGAVATLALCAPSSLIAFVFESHLARYRQARWNIVFRHALPPLTIGLMLATGVLFIRGIHPNLAALVLVSATVGITLLRRWNPLWLLAAGAVLGAAGYI